MIGHRPLSEVIVGWPEWAPQTLTKLADTEPELLKENLDGEPDQVKTLVWQLRAEVIRDRQAGSKLPPMRQMETVTWYLENGRLVPKAYEWLAVGLDADRYRILRPYFVKRDDQWEQRLRYVAKYYKDVPSPDELEELPPDGVWLIVYGQGPEVLSSATVRERLRHLIESAPVCEVVFNHLAEGGRRTVYSLRDRVGATPGPTGWQRVEFPDHLRVEEASCWN